MEGVEAELKWPITLPPATLEIRLLRDGTVRLYAKLEQHLKKPQG